MPGLPVCSGTDETNNQEGLTLIMKIAWGLLLGCTAFVTYGAVTAPYEVTAAKYKCAQQFKGGAARGECMQRLLYPPNTAPEIQLQLSRSER